MDSKITLKWTDFLKQVVLNALDKAEQNNTPSVMGGHLLLSIGEANGSLGAALLKKTKFDINAFAELMRLSSSGEQKAALSPQAQNLLFKATALAHKMQHTHVGTEHLLLVIVKNPSIEIKNFAAATNWDLNDLESQLQMILKSNSRLRELTGSFFDELDLDIDENEDLPQNILEFGIHLTNPNKIKTFDPVIGRERELNRMMQILTRRTKNNPVLLGEAGVGKTALVEALAERIYKGEVPQDLLGKKIVALETGSLVAGTMYRGEFEQRIKILLDELYDRDDIILFIDELHTIVGAGSASGSVDAANLLKPALARGRLRCIGATTLSEYRQHIENDSALERRFQPVTVNEPSAELTRQMLNGLRSRYEQYHKVKVTDAVLDNAVLWSERYLPDRHLPDKAIDLLDETAAAAKLKIPTSPNAIKIHALKRELKECIKKKENATNKEDFGNALIWKNRCTAINAEIVALEKLLSEKSILPEVSMNDLSETLTNWTGIPVSHQHSERQRLLAEVEQNLASSISGQTEAIKTVSQILRRAHLGLASESKPLASFLFVGPTGVGKTTLAKNIAKELFKSDKAVLRLDMSEYAEGYAVSKLIGAPAGYVGYKESGFLTEKVRRQPYQVILFDELDRAHRDVLNLLLQLLEEGSLRDSTGKLINFKQTIVIATANTERNNGNSLGFNRKQNTSIEDVALQAAELFPTELRERFDAIVPFGSLNDEALHTIFQTELSSLNKKLSVSGTSLGLSSKAKSDFLKKVQGQNARKLKQIFIETIEHPILEKISNVKKYKPKYQLDIEKNKWKIT